MSNINEIKGALRLGGARPALFRVHFTNPVDGSGDLIAPFLIKASSVPDSTVGEIRVPYFGREIKEAGVREFGDWNVTVLNDEDFLVRNALEAWSGAINTHESNVRDLATSSSLLYKSQATVTQYGKTGDIIRTYQFNGLWPKTISEMELAWENGNAIQEFNVTFALDSFYVISTVTGSGGAI